MSRVKKCIVKYKTKNGKRNHEVSLRYPKTGRINPSWLPSGIDLNRDQGPAGQHEPGQLYKPIPTLLRLMGEPSTPFGSMPSSGAQLSLPAYPASSSMPAPKLTSLKEESSKLSGGGHHFMYRTEDKAGVNKVLYPPPPISPWIGGGVIKSIGAKNIKL